MLQLLWQKCHRPDGRRSPESWWLESQVKDSSLVSDGGLVWLPDAISLPCPPCWRQPALSGSLVSVLTQSRELHPHDLFMAGHHDHASPGVRDSTDESRAYFSVRSSENVGSS